MHRVFYFSNLCKKSESPIRVIWIRLKKNRPCKHSCWLSFFFFFFFFFFLISSFEESFIFTNVNTVVDSVFFFFFFFLHFLIRSLEESLILTTEFWKIIKLIQLRIKSIYDDIRIWSAVVLAAFQTQVLHILLGFLNLFFSPKKTPLLSEMTIHIQALDLLNHKPHTAFTDHTTYQDRSRLSISRLHSAAVYILKLSTEPSQKHTCTCLIQRGYVSL